MDDAYRKKQLINQTLRVLLFMFASTLFLFICSWTTSVLYETSKMGNIGDSVIFRLLGTLTRKGMIPYKEFFDHKGPVIIVIEYLGCLISNEKLGIFIIQIFFLTASLCGINKIFRLYYSEKWSTILTILTLLVLNLYFEGGNLTEEYCLPFLVWSTYFAVKYAKNRNTIVHNPWYSFFYGISFMIGALTRPTNALPICIIVIMGFGLLLYKKEWKNIIKNTLFFILGLCLVLTPFLIYFQRQNALYEMFYATILYNIRYAQNREHIVLTMGKCVYLLPLIISIMLGIISIYNKIDRFIAYCVILLSVSGIILQLNSLPYSHYLMIWIPTLVLALGIFIENYTQERMKKVIIFISLLFVGIVLTKNVKTVYNWYKNCNENSIKPYEREVKDIIRWIPQEDRDYVIGYNVSAYFYIISDIKPCYKYCILQDWQCSHDQQIYSEFRESIKSLKAKYIVMGRWQDNIQSDLIRQYYMEVNRTDNFILLKNK